MKRTLNMVLVLAFCACSGQGRGDNASVNRWRDPYRVLASGLSAARDRVPNRKVAVLPFSYTDKRESDDGVVVSERLLTSLIRERKLEVVERNLLEKVMGELKLQYSGAVDERSIKSLGKILGVDAVVTGTLMRRPGGLLEINARVIGVENGMVLAAAAVVAPADWETEIIPAETAQAAAEPEAVPQAAAQEEKAPAEDFPAAWKYRENLRVAERSGKSLVDHQVLVELDTAALIRAGRMRADCADLRFVNSNEKSRLNYWLESGCGASRTRVWVRLPFLAKKSVKNIYVYYGNTAAGPVSNGAATFLLFDDFEGSWIDTSRWLVRGECPVRQEGGLLRFTGCGYGSSIRKTTLTSAQGLQAPYVVEFSAMASDGGNNGITHELALRWDGVIAGPYAQPRSAVAVVLFDGYSPGSACRGEDCLSGRAAITWWQNGSVDHMERVSEDNSLTPGVWRNYGVVEDGREVAIYLGGKKLVSTPVAVSSGDKLGIGAREYPHGAESYYDNFRVRRHASPEPSVYQYKKAVELSAGRSEGLRI